MRNRNGPIQVWQWTTESGTKIKVAIHFVQLSLNCFSSEIQLVCRPARLTDGQRWHTFIPFLFQVCERAIWLNDGWSIHYYSPPPHNPTKPTSTRSISFSFLSNFLFKKHGRFAPLKLFDAWARYSWVHITKIHCCIWLDIVRMGSFLLFRTCQLVKYTL